MPQGQHLPSLLFRNPSPHIDTFGKRLPTVVESSGLLLDQNRSFAHPSNELVNGETTVSPLPIQTPEFAICTDFSDFLPKSLSQNDLKAGGRGIEPHSTMTGALETPCCPSSIPPKFGIGLHKAFLMFQPWPGFEPVTNFHAFLF